MFIYNSSRIGVYVDRKFKCACCILLFYIIILIGLYLDKMDWYIKILFFIYLSCQFDIVDIIKEIFNKIKGVK